MTTATKSDAKPASPDAVSLLMDDHKKVEKLFKEYAKLAKDDDLLNEAEVKVLGEYIDHHVEEETEMFPTARKAKMDPEELMSGAGNREQLRK